MRIFGVGDLVCDIYIHENHIVGVDGGKSFANIVVSLARFYKCYIWGVCGVDECGKVACTSLKDLHVNTKYIEKRKITTRRFYIDYSNRITTKRDFQTGKKYWYPKSFVSLDIFSILKSDDILIFDSLNDINVKIIQNTKQKKMLDIGYSNELENMTKEEIFSIFQNHISIININEKVEQYFLTKFKTLSFLKTDLLIVTRGKSGASFRLGGEWLHLSIPTPSQEIDTNGLGDLFFSHFIRLYLSTDCLSMDTIYLTFQNAIVETSNLATKVGARSHLHAIYSFSDYCLQKRRRADTMEI